MRLMLRRLVVAVALMWASAMVFWIHHVHYAASGDPTAIFASTADIPTSGLPTGARSLHPRTDTNLSAAAAASGVAASAAAVEAAAAALAAAEVDPILALFGEAMPELAAARQKHRPPDQLSHPPPLSSFSASPRPPNPPRSPPSLDPADPASAASIAASSRELPSAANQQATPSAHASVASRDAPLAAAVACSGRIETVTNGLGCFDVAKGKSGGSVRVDGCAGASANQQWCTQGSTLRTRQLSVAGEVLCLDCGVCSVGSALTMQPCVAGKRSQAFEVLSLTTSQIQSLHWRTICIAAKDLAARTRITMQPCAGEEEMFKIRSQQWMVDERKDNG